MCSKKKAILKVKLNYPIRSNNLLTFLDEEDDGQEVQHQRNERACKGRRYQEFKDQALGRKGVRNSRHRSGDRSSLDGKFKIDPN